MIDGDLGRSAAGGVQRAGFERMVAEVRLGKGYTAAGVSGKIRRKRRNEWLTLNVDNREHPELATGCQLIVTKIHRPGLVRSCRWPMIVPQFGLTRRFGALLRVVGQIHCRCAASCSVSTRDMNASVAVANPRPGGSP